MADPELDESLTDTVLEGRYRLGRVLGSGSMGHVYEAEQMGLGRSVAVKMLRGALLSSSGALERFKTEALAMSRINHPNAVAIFDFGVSPTGIPFLVMECLRGKPLSALITDGPLAASRVVPLGAQILSAIEEAHSCGVVHRDLKADNVVVDTLRDGSDFVKVVDFGIACLADKPSAEQVVAGTPEYMAPEQIRGEPVRATTDIYAVGVMLYEMIVGRTPFAGTATMEVLQRHLSEDPTPPERIVPSCPPDLSRIILRSLAKAPGERFQTATEMRAALVAALGTQPGKCERCGEPAPAGSRFCNVCAAGASFSKPKVAVSPLLSTGATAQTGTRATGSNLRQRPARMTLELEQGATGLIGRGAEAHRLVEFWRRGTGALAVVGPVGVGKARLVLDVAHQAAGEAVSFLATPDPSGFRLSWYPLISMVQTMLGLDAQPTLQALGLAVARAGLPERDVPGLAEFFGLEGPVAQLDVPARRRELRAAVQRTLLSAERRCKNPVLCFVNVDRYDAPSRDVVAALVEAAATSKVRVVVTAADEAALPPGMTTLTLGGLSPADAFKLVTSLVRPGATLPPAEVVAERTGGVPALVEQFVGWLALGNLPTQAPERVADLISARLAQIPAPARKVLQAVAAHGQVAARGPIDPILVELDPDGSALRGLVQAHLLIVERHLLTIPFAPVAELVAASTPAEARRELAHRMLAHLEPSTPAGVVGHFAEVAGDLQQSLAGYVTAGEDAVRRFDNEGGAAWYGRAQGVARRLYNQGEIEAPVMVEAAIRLADCLRATNNHRLALGCLDEAEALDPTPEQRAAIARTRGRVALGAQDPKAAAEHLRRAIGLALRGGGRDFLCELYLDLATALVAANSTMEAISELSEAIDLLSFGEGLAALTTPVTAWRVAFRLTELLLRAGDVARGRAVALDALTMAKNIASSTGQGKLHALLAQIAEVSRLPQEAASHRAQALDCMRRVGDRRTTAELLIACARSTGELPTAGAKDSPSQVTARKAIQIARELAVEIDWKEGVVLTDATPPRRQV